MILTFVFSGEDIFRSVKQEASLFARNQYDVQGNPLFEQYVFDEAYDILFKKLFFEAQAEVLSAVSAYFKGIPQEPEIFEPQNFDKEKDFIFQLSMPGSFMEAMAKPADIKIKQFLVDYILYLWLRTKSQPHAGVYLAQSAETLAQVKALLERRMRPQRRKGRLF